MATSVDRQHHQQGEGEWFAKTHGPFKPRQWRKVHLGIDADKLEIRAIKVTGSRVGDAAMLPELLNQIASDSSPWPCNLARWSRYHRRSLIETKMPSFKLLGERVMARDFDRQVVRLQIRTTILNRFTALCTSQAQRLG